MVKKIHGSSRDYIIHPGETLDEILEDRNMNQKELAIRCGVSEKHISTIINGQKSISVDFAKKLEYALGIESIFWINLQANYDKEITAFEDFNNISEDEINVVKGLKNILVEYQAINLITDNISSVDTVLELRKLFNVSNLTNIPKLTHIGAYRISQNKNNIDPYVLYAWEKLCEYYDAKNSNDCELNIKLLKKSISEIKKIMFLDSNLIVGELKKVLSKCGISLYLMKNYSGAPVQGYIRKSSGNGIALFMTVREKFADIFWFTLFHEIAHILNGDVNSIFIDFDDMPEDIEKKANDLAADELISKKIL